MNAEGIVLHVEVSEGAFACLNQLLASGLYGHTVQDVARRLIDDGLLDRIAADHQAVRVKVGREFAVATIMLPHVFQQPLPKGRPFSRRKVEAAVVRHAGRLEKAVAKSAVNASKIWRSKIPRRKRARR